ncbi:MAG: Na/Pi cotransporter family protein [Prevotella sp.]|nr:Na/Pi cotransporter family protein [Prevotella sp.]
METEQNYLMIAMQVLGALGLLIYGMRMMSEALQKMTGPQLRHILARMTTNRLAGMLTGMFVTCAVQSSSATTVMTVSFVSAGLLTLAQAISIIMGANIGTTLTAWIMSLGYSVDLTNVVFPAFLVGMILIYKKRHRYVGDFLFGIAFLFLSLVMLSTAGRALDLEHNEAAINFFASFNVDSHLTILAFLGIGTLITCIVQSSAAVMAITILLCSTGVLPIYLGIALVMGENIGTTATANLAALGEGTEARRAALAHLLFNVFGVMWVLIVFYPFVDMVCRLVGYDPTAGGQTERLPMVLAMFHTCFNVTNTAILIGLVPQMERIVCWLMPDRQQPKHEEFRLKYIQGNLVQTPEISILQAQKETVRFAEGVKRMFGMVKELLAEENEKRFADCFRMIEHEEDITDRMELEIAQYIEQLSDDHLSDDSKEKIRQMMREVGELESVGDACYNLAHILNRREQSGLTFTPQQKEALTAMMKLCDDALEQMCTVLSEQRKQQNLQESLRIENDINSMRDHLKKNNIIAVDEHKYDYSLGSIFGDMVSELERLGDYVINVVEAKFGK